MEPRFTHKKSLGQHFLNSPVVPDWMVEAATLSPRETVLEIGPGTGALTRALLEAGAQVIALEADQRAIDILRDAFATEIASGALTLHHHDVRSLDLARLGLRDHNYKVVANIPYYLSGFLFRTLLQNPVQPSTLVFLVQKEVGKRAVANPSRGEKTSLLSIALSVYGSVRYVRTVPRGHFTPIPKVDSAIIAVEDISRNHFGDGLSEADFFTLLHLGYGQKRKQLMGNLRATLPHAPLPDIFHDLQLTPTVRAEDLGVGQWVTLARRLSPYLSTVTPPPSPD